MEKRNLSQSSDSERGCCSGNEPAEIYNGHRCASWNDLTQEGKRSFWSHDITQSFHNCVLSTLQKYRITSVKETALQAQRFLHTLIHIQVENKRCVRCSLA